MTMGQWVASNHNNADEYVGSAWPYVKNLILEPDTTVRITFPSVTKFVKIINSTTQSNDNRTLRVGFRAEDVSTLTTIADPQNYIVIPSGATTGEMPIKCKDIYLRGNNGQNVNVSIIAGCTNIPLKNFPNFPFEKPDTDPVEYVKIEVEVLPSL